MLHRIPLLVLGLFVATAMACASDIPSADFADDEKLLKDAKIATDGPGLLDFYRQRILTAAQVDRIDSLIELLGDANFKKRAGAARDLKAIGSPSLPALRLGLKVNDLESRRRAAEIIRVIQNDALSDRLCAAARLLRDRRPTGAVRVLVDYLPFAEDSDVEAEVLETLILLVVQAGKVDPALVAVLLSKTPAQRAAAAMLIGWAGTPEQRRAVRILLDDPDATVRFRAAQGLFAGRDKAAVPALISLLQGVPWELSERAEDLLQRAAGSHAPTITLGESPRGRQRCAAAWREWYKTNLDTLDLAQRDVSLPVFNIDARAKFTALRWIRSLVKGDRSSWRKTSTAPFALVDYHFQVFDKREDLDRLFGSAVSTHDAEMARPTFLATDVVSVDRYLNSGATTSREANRDLGEVIPSLRAYFLSRQFL